MKNLWIFLLIIAIAMSMTLSFPMNIIQASVCGFVLCLKIITPAKK